MHHPFHDFVVSSLLQSPHAKNPHRLCLLFTEQLGSYQEKATHTLCRMHWELWLGGIGEKDFHPEGNLGCACYGCWPAMDVLNSTASNAAGDPYKAV